MKIKRIKLVTPLRRSELQAVRRFLLANPRLSASGYNFARPDELPSYARLLRCTGYQADGWGWRAFKKKLLVKHEKTIITGLPRRQSIKTKGNRND